jgi:hypothetical protein
LTSRKGTEGVAGTQFDALGKKILEVDKSILSLTINDDKGDIFGRAFTAEYEKKYLESAKELRSRAGLFSALMYGISSEPEKIFGPTKAVIRVYEEVKLILIPFSNRKLMATLLTKSRVNDDQLIKDVSAMLREP